MSTAASNTSTESVGREYGDAGQRIIQKPDKATYTRRRLAVAASTATVIAGAIAAPHVIEGVQNLIEANEPHVIANEVFTLAAEPSISIAAQHEVEGIFLDQKIDPSAIPYGQITEQANKASAAYTDITGEIPQTDATFVLTVNGSEVGNYSITIVPTAQTE